MDYGLFLHSAVAKCEIEKVKSFLENGIRIDVEEGTEGAIIETKEGKTTHYIHTKADLSLVHPEHGAPLHIAIKTCNKPMIDLLIEYRADVNAKTEESGLTPLQLCVTKVLFEQDEEEEEGSMLDTVKLLCEHRANTNVTDPITGTTPLWDALMSNSIPLIKILLEGGAEPFTESPEGETLLFPAVSNEDIHLVELLLKHGMSTRINRANLEGFTPLHVAAYSGMKEMVEFLLSNGASGSLHKRNEGGNTPYEEALAAGANECAEILQIWKDKETLEIIPTKDCISPLLYITITTTKRKEEKRKMERDMDMEGENLLLYMCENWINSPKDLLALSLCNKSIKTSVWDNYKVWERLYTTCFGFIPEKYKNRGKSSYIYSTAIRRLRRVNRMEEREESIDKEGKESLSDTFKVEKVKDSSLLTKNEGKEKEKKENEDEEGIDRRNKHRNSTVMNQQEQNVKEVVVNKRKKEKERTLKKKEVTTLKSKLWSVVFGQGRPFFACKLFMEGPSWIHCFKETLCMIKCDPCTGRNIDLSFVAHFEGEPFAIDLLMNQVLFTPGTFEYTRYSATAFITEGGESILMEPSPYQRSTTLTTTDVGVGMDNKADIASVCVICALVDYDNNNRDDEELGKPSVVSISDLSMLKDDPLLSSSVPKVVVGVSLINGIKKEKDEDGEERKTINKLMFPMHDKEEAIKGWVEALGCIYVECVLWKEDYSGGKEDGEDGNIVHQYTGGLGLRRVFSTVAEVAKTYDYSHK